jgi:hypothetical protein
MAKKKSARMASLKAMATDCHLTRDFGVLLSS